MELRTHRLRATLWGLGLTAVLAALVVAGSRNLTHFDAALVGYTFATLFATFAITYRYAMWLQRPPTRMYWRRGWQGAVRSSRRAGALRPLLRERAHGDGGLRLATQSSCAPGPPVARCCCTSNNVFAR